ncbi:MAG: hypothetical protein IIX63_00185 [Treponema sp.]|nr:hypothetical protein [Treponema sp.]
MKKSFRLFCAFISILSFFTFSCQHELLPSPKNETTTDQNQNQETIIGTVPENLVATHGLKGKIELSWQGVQDTARYNIYEAATPYDKFIQIAETTTNTTSYTLEEKSGASKYYKVTAVNRNGKESPFSIVAHGTTLAIPVITYIGQDEQNSDSACSVHWYMNNCNSATYQQNVRYTINCFDPQGNNVAEKVHDGNADYPSITFEDLIPNTNYTYQITAYIVTHQNDTEVSDKADAATARRLRPNAPENLSATLGTSTTENTITFDLPAMVDVALGNGIYEPKPLYFKIYRKLAADEDTAENWKIIESKFDQTKFGTQYTPSNPDQIYEPGQTVTYVDTKDLKRGIMYDYKVQSYADETNREISSNLSIATTKGFLMGIPNFQTTNYEAIKNSEETQYVKVSTNFSFNWNMFGYENNYGFILGEKRYKLEIDNSDSKDETGDTETFTYFKDISSINEYTKTFDLTNAEELINIRGYYSYKLYIIQNPSDDYIAPSPGSTFDSVLQVEAFGKVLVTQDTSKPEIANFSTVDGYKDKILLSWTYDETIQKYEITYELEDGTEAVIEDLSTALTNATNGSTITYEHKVESGFYATYTLTAFRGINVSTEPVKLYTLGTPILTFDNENPKYDNISVTWNPVNKVDSYELSYSVDNGTSYTSPIEIPASTTELENLTINADESFTYKFVQPTNYDDATFSGKDILVKIQAKNTLNSTTNNVIAKTLGPALTKKLATVALSTESINVKWNKVQGAKKYLIKRERYSADNKSILSTDFYYVNTDASKVAVDGEDIDTSKYVKISYDEIALEYKLEDSSYPNTGNTKWQINQDRINWGFPYHYTVFPLENETDSFDVETGALADKVTYKNLSDVESIGSALGYGHNVTATKSEDPRKITITWDKPYLSDKASYEPVLCRSKAGENKWEQQTDIDIESNATEAIFEPIGKERIQPYEFAIVYYKTSEEDFHLNQSYLDDLASKIDEYKEPINKGYAFAIETEARNVLVGQSATYNEKILWTLWDYEKRARGPKNDAVYTVSMQNNNLGDDWKKVATYKNDGTVTINNPAEYETTITQQGNGIVIAPNGLASNDNAVHNGLLKVLRDYKHYVKVIVTRVNSEGQEITASFADDEENNYIVRKITEGELTKSISLIIADAIYQAGISSGGSRECGYFFIEHPSATKKIIYGTNDKEYTHIFKGGTSSTLNKEFKSSWTVKIPNSTKTSYSANNNSLFYLPEVSITITNSEVELDSYKGTMVFSAGKEGQFFGGCELVWSLNIKINDKPICSISDNKNDFLNWFPYTLGDSQGDSITSYTESEPIYQSPWWN